jgi:hypothetical protein
MLDTLSKYLRAPGSVKWPVSNRSTKISIGRISRNSAAPGSRVVRTLMTVAANRQSHIQILTTLAWLAATVRSASSPISYSEIELDCESANDLRVMGVSMSV